MSQTKKKRSKDSDVTSLRQGERSVTSTSPSPTQSTFTKQAPQDTSRMILAPGRERLSNVSEFIPASLAFAPPLAASSSASATKPRPKARANAAPPSGDATKEKDKDKEKKKPDAANAEAARAVAEAEAGGGAARGAKRATAAGAPAKATRTKREDDVSAGAGPQAESSISVANDICGRRTNQRAARQRGSQEAAEAAEAEAAAAAAAKAGPKGAGQKAAPRRAAPAPGEGPQADAPPRRPAPRAPRPTSDNPGSMHSVEGRARDRERELAVAESEARPERRRSSGLGAARWEKGENPGFTHSAIVRTRDRERELPAAEGEVRTERRRSSGFGGARTERSDNPGPTHSSTTRARDRERELAAAESEARPERRRSSGLGAARWEKRGNASDGWSMASGTMGQRLSVASAPRIDSGISLQDRRPALKGPGPNQGALRPGERGSAVRIRFQSQSQTGGPAPDDTSSLETVSSSMLLLPRRRSVQNPPPYTVQSHRHEAAIVWVVGPPGVGKRTLCENLRKEMAYRASLVEVIDWATLVKRPTQRLGGRRVDPTDAAVVAAVQAAVSPILLARCDCVLLCNFPLNLNQALMFEKLVRSADALLALRASLKELVARTLGGAGARPKAVDFALVSSRVDDYYKHMESVLSRYQQRLVLVEADGRAESVLGTVRRRLQDLDLVHPLERRPGPPPRPPLPLLPPPAPAPLSFAGRFRGSISEQARYMY